MRTSGTAGLYEKWWQAHLETEKKFHETDRKFQETDRKFQETDQKIKALAELFTGQWGKLVESLLSPGCIEVFQKRGIHITQSSSNVISKKGGREMEIDVLLVNNTELVAMEVKTTARVKHVREVLEEMEEFNKFFPQYSRYHVYGAIAALRFEENCDKYAMDKGLFVLKATGNNLIKIDNGRNFKPKSF